jgi:hypothetical protein
MRVLTDHWILGVNQLAELVTTEGNKLEPQRPGGAVLASSVLLTVCGNVCGKDFYIMARIRTWTLTTPGVTWDLDYSVSIYYSVVFWLNHCADLLEPSISSRSTTPARRGEMRVFNQIARM